MTNPNFDPQIDEPSEELKTEFRNQVIRLTHNTHGGERESLLSDGRLIAVAAPESLPTLYDMDKEGETHLDPDYLAIVTEEIPRAGGGAYIRRKSYSLSPYGDFTKSSEVETINADGNREVGRPLGALFDEFVTTIMFTDMGLDLVTGSEASDLVELLQAIPDGPETKHT